MAENEFAQWAFSPFGFPNLQVLASGDFSHGRRFPNQQRLLCRNRSRTAISFRDIREDDFREQDLIDANMDLLTACPVTPYLFQCADPYVFPGVN